MKKLLLPLIVITLAGGGFYWYTQSGEVLDEAAPIVTNEPLTITDQMMDLEMMNKLIPDEPQEEPQLDTDTMENIANMVKNTSNLSDEEKINKEKEAVMAMNPGMNEEGIMDANETITMPKMLAKGVEMSQSDDASTAEEGMEMIAEAIETMSESGQRMSSEQMQGNGATRQGHFTEIDLIHKGKGKAIVYPETASGPTLRLENFSVTRGPDLYVYLSKNVNITSADQLGKFHSLGKLKSSKGNQNYKLPDNFEEYQSVVIWCQAFGVLFSSATLYP